MLMYGKKIIIILYSNYLPPPKKSPIAWASLVVQMVESLPAMQGTQVRSLGQEDPLEKERTNLSNILAWKI